MEYGEILQTVIENGRVSSDNGSFNIEELKIEIEFEAITNGLSDEEVDDCVEYALEHTRHT